jgi:hypothetical protein
MTLLTKITTSILFLSGTTLNAQWFHWGVDGMLGVHCNLADGPAYKTPVGDGGPGVHVAISDLNGTKSLSFNGRLSYTNDHEIHSIYPGNTLNISFRDVVTSFQVVMRVNEELRMYSGINFSINTVNTIRQRYGGTVFIDQGTKVPQLETVLGKSIRKVNAGVECGFMYNLGKGFSIGLHTNYYLMKRLNEDLDLSVHGFVKKTSLNFRPVSLRMQVSFDIS